jgi:hypothetical protein
MHLLIAADGTLSLEEVDDLKSFSIVEADPGSAQGTAATALDSIGEAAEANHYWLGADSVVSLSPRKDDQAWVDAFWGMLEKVERYGFSDLQGKRVKAHVETAG